MKASLDAIANSVINEHTDKAQLLALCIAIAKTTLEHLYPTTS